MGARGITATASLPGRKNTLQRRCEKCGLPTYSRTGRCASCEVEARVELSVSRDRERQGNA